MHLEVTDIREENRLPSNRRRKAPVENFTVEDFVWYAIPQQHRESKLAFKLQVPGRIVEVVSDDVFVVENIVTHASLDSCTAPSVLFESKNLNVTTDLLNHIHHDDNGLEIEDVVHAKLDKKGK